MGGSPTPAPSNALLHSLQTARQVLLNPPAPDALHGGTTSTPSNRSALSDGSVVKELLNDDLPEAEIKGLRPELRETGLTRSSYSCAERKREREKRSERERRGASERARARARESKREQERARESKRERERERDSYSCASNVCG
jgi:hypothetical protein